MKKEDFEKYFIGADISKNTINTHISRILRLNKLSNNKYEKIEDLLNDYKNIIKLINKNWDKTSTKKSYYISIVSISKRINKLKNKNIIKDEAMEQYYNYMEDNRDKNNIEINENQKTKKQKENWMEWTEIIKIPNIIKKDLDKKDNSKFEKYDKYTKYVIICLYTMIPPVRLDYHKINVFENEKDIKKYIDYDRYIVFKKDNSEIHFNKFKNVKKIGKQVFTLPKELEKIIKEYYQFLKDNDYPHKYLFYSPKYKKEFSSNAFGQYLQRIFEKYTKKTMDINMLRHSYESYLTSQPWYHKLSLNEREKYHNQVLHSMNTGLQYIKLDNKKKDNKITIEEGREILKKLGYKII
jgi:hypothetical protein